MKFDLHKDVIFVPEYKDFIICGYDENNTLQEIIDIINHTQNLVAKNYHKNSKVFVLPHFRYCSLIWHFCGKRNSERLGSLNRRILRYIFHDKESNYHELLSQANTSTLYNC